MKDWRKQQIITRNQCFKLRHRIKTTLSLDTVGLEFPMLDSWKIFFSYCLAVTAATIPYVMLIMLRGISNFELATTYSAETKTQHFIEMSYLPYLLLGFLRLSSRRCHFLSEL